MHVRPIHAGEISPVALALARSFADDPFTRWLFGEEAVEPLRRTFEAQLRVLYVDKGLGFTTDDCAGAALWSPLDRYKPTIVESLRLAPVHLRILGPRRARKALAGFNEIESHHPNEPHRYLAILGVDPDRQRSGVGRALLEHGVAETPDRPIYLDTSKEDNVPYYRSHGFEVNCQFDIPHGGPHMWGMLRGASG